MVSNVKKTKINRNVPMKTVNIIQCSSIERLRDAIYVPNAIKLFYVSQETNNTNWEWIKKVVEESGSNARIYIVPYHIVLQVEEFPELSSIPTIVLFQSSQVIQRLFISGDYKNVLLSALKVYNDSGEQSFNNDAKQSLSESCN